MIRVFFFWFQRPKVAITYTEDILDKEEQFQLICDDVVIFKTSGLLHAMLGLMMAKYTFNLAYPKCFEKTLSVLQRVFLGVDDESAIDRRLLVVIAQLNQAM
jgi:hypothetical protein